MKKTAIRLSLVGCALLLTVAAVLIIIPFFVDAQKYRSHIQRRAIAAFGQRFEIGHRPRLSLFPRTRLKFYDPHVVNPAGFTEKEFIKARGFAVRFKLLPFIFSGFQDIQSTGFDIEGPEIMLVKTADGRLNWEGLGNLYDALADIISGGGKRVLEKITAELSASAAPAFDRLSITDGIILWIDHQKKSRIRMSHIDMNLKNLACDRPVRIALSAETDAGPLKLKGKLGPLGSLQSPGTIPVKLSLSALNQLALTLDGHLKKPFEKLEFDVLIKLSRFSVPELATAVGRPLPITFSDKSALDSVALKARASGDFQSIEISDGVLDLDESRIKITVKLHSYSRPDISFDCSLDHIDLSRYRPAGSSQKTATGPKTDGSMSFVGSASPIRGRRENPLRQLVLKGSLAAQEVMLGNTVAKNITAALVAKNGVLHFAPVRLEIYGGKLAASGSVSVRKEAPETNLRLYTQNFQLGRLLQDIWQKDSFSGTLNSKITLRMKGQNSVQIKKSLTGKGDIRIDRGAIAGVDLLAMMRKNTGSPGISNPTGKKPETTFSKFLLPFSVNRGIVYSPNATLLSSQVRINAAGKADLFKELLDIRLDPVAVPSRKEEKKKSISFVPVRISGSFSEPEFRPILADGGNTGFEKNRE